MRIGNVCGFESEGVDNLFVPKEVVGLDVARILERIVNCPDFPPSVGQRPFVMLPDVDVVFLLDIASENEIEFFG